MLLSLLVCFHTRHLRRDVSSRFVSLTVFSCVLSFTFEEHERAFICESPRSSCTCDCSDPDFDPCNCPGIECFEKGFDVFAVLFIHLLSSWRSLLFQHSLWGDCGVESLKIDQDKTYHIDELFVSNHKLFTTDSLRVIPMKTQRSFKKLWNTNSFSERTGSNHSVCFPSHIVFLLPVFMLHAFFRDLSNNSLGSIQLDQLPPNLTSLDLTKNSLHALSGNAPQSLKKMFVLFLSLFNNFIMLCFHTTDIFQIMNLLQFQDNCFPCRTSSRCLFYHIITYICASIIHVFGIYHHRDMSHNDIQKTKKLPQGLGFLFVTTHHFRQ